MILGLVWVPYTKSEVPDLNSWATTNCCDHRHYGWRHWQQCCRCVVEVRCYQWWAVDDLTGYLLVIVLTPLAVVNGGPPVR